VVKIEYRKESKKMKCYVCKATDSISLPMYLDKNKRLLSELELKAFRVLHPEAAYIQFEKVMVCGICKFEMEARKAE
jgi:hypothetical protein